MPEILTPRLRLRPHVLADFDAYRALWADPQVVRFIGGEPLTREQAWIRFLRQAGCWHHMGFGYFAVLDRADGRFLGEAGVQEARRAVEPSIEGTLEAGWALVPEAWGRGIASEAVAALVAWSETTFPGLRMTCLIDTEHAASRRIAGKAGFRLSAETAYHGRQVVLMERDGAPGAA